MTHLKPAEIPTVRILLARAQAAGWVHLVYGGDSHGRYHEHVWRKPGQHLTRAEQISLYDGEIEYRPEGSRQPTAKLRPESAIQVTAWLRMLGFAATGERAAAVLAPDSAQLPAEVAA